MKRVILESPFAANKHTGMSQDDHISYARWCARDCLNRDESPIASHLLFPQFLDEETPSDRILGIKAGLVWLPVADYSVYYTDHGWSGGMLNALHNYSLAKQHDFRIRALFGLAKLPASLDEHIENLLKSKID